MWCKQPHKYPFTETKLKIADIGFYELSLQENLLVGSFHETCSQRKGIDCISPNQESLFPRKLLSYQK